MMIVFLINALQSVSYYTLARFVPPSRLLLHKPNILKSRLFKNFAENLWINCTYFDCCLFKYLIRKANSFWLDWLINLTTLVFLHLELFLFTFGKLKTWMRTYAIVWSGDHGYFNSLLLTNWRIKKKKLMICQNVTNFTQTGRCWCTVKFYYLMTFI